MRFIYSCQTDVGAIRKENQDSLVVKSLNTCDHVVLFAAVCDGVGGLNQGEITSRRAAEILSDWFDYELPQIMRQPQLEEVLHYRFRQLISDLNREIYYSNYRSGISSATTLSAILLWDYHYLIGHVGDSRIYEINRQAVQLTQDHSWVAQEVAKGHMSLEEASQDSRQNVIIKCIGMEPDVNADFLDGKICEPTVILLCTDGFWHHVAWNEWERWFSPIAVHNEKQLTENLYYIADQVKCRGESDNITAIAIHVF